MKILFRAFVIALLLVPPSVTFAMRDEHDPDRRPGCSQVLP
jgi:hypothetical protein